jgi:hypothetical protein
MWNTIIKDLLSRKWLAFIAVETCSYIALMTNHLSEATWRDISLCGLGLFAGANVAEKIWNKGGEVK